MGKIVEGVKTINSAVRTFLMSLAVGVLGIGGFFGYNEYTKHDREIQEREEQLQLLRNREVALLGEIGIRDAEIEFKTEEISRLETSLKLLKTDQRLARLNVLGIERDDSGKVLKSMLEFVEMSPNGEPLSEPKKFELPGDLVYIDNWVVKFDDIYIENGDVAKGTSLCLFKRIFSEEQTPNDGFSLDEVGMRPQAYSRGGALTEFEKQLWGDFWEFANDSEKAKAMGIRAANGEAVSIKIREGASYDIELRASGGLSINPSTRKPTVKDPA